MKTQKAAALSAQIAQLELRLMEARAAYVSTIAESFDKIEKAAAMGSGVILRINGLGGGEIIPPVLIRDGLSREAINALRHDLGRSYGIATIANGQILEYMP